MINCFHNITRDLKNALQKSNENEQYFRLESIRIYGVKESQNEDSGEVVCDIMKEKLGIEMCPGDINRVHRLNQVYPTVNKPRAIIVKFFSHAIKRRCVLNRKKLKGRVS